MIDRRDPTDFRHRAGVRRTQLDFDPMAIVRVDLAARPVQALTLHLDKIMLRWLAMGLEPKDAAFGLKSFEGRQIVS